MLLFIFPSLPMYSEGHMQSNHQNDQKYNYQKKKHMSPRTTTHVSRVNLAEVPNTYIYERDIVYKPKRNMMKCLNSQ